MKTKIYLYCAPEGLRPGDVLGFALAEDGHGLASHLSSSVEWSKRDMGLISDRKHDGYAKCYPDGFELEWVDDPYKHEGVQKALKLNKKLAKEQKD